MLIWTLIMEKVATLKELETHWCLDDAIRAFAVIEIRADQQERILKNSKAK